MARQYSRTQPWADNTRTPAAAAARVLSQLRENPPQRGGDLTSARVSKKIAPHQPGAMRWQAKYGEQLLCVRYRDDPSNGRRVVTVELLVDQRPLPTRPPPPDTLAVGVLVQYDETELRLRAKAHGGTWDPKARLWRLTRAQAAAAGLEDRIQAEG